MSLEHLEYITPLVEDARKAGEFSGCVVTVGRRQGVVWQKAFGDRQQQPTTLPMTKDALFDLASLTKPISTATSVMLLVERGKLRLRDPAFKHLPGLDRKPTRAITIEHLLTHTAGYIPDNPLADYRHGVDESWKRLYALDPRTPPGESFKYSDVGFLLLGKIVEVASHRPLNEFVKQQVYQQLGMNDTGYLPPPELRKRGVATEKRDGRWLVGEVHDPRAALLEGVAGHAGLFSTAGDLAIYAQAMLSLGTRHKQRVMGQATVREMFRPRTVDGHLRAAGWDVRSSYSRNRGDLLSGSAVGHGGFTGTAIWIDPELDLFVVFLSSRLHPDGKGTVNDLAGRIGSIAAAALRE